MVIPNQKIATRYKKWIDQNYPTTESALGNCHQACKAMKQAFPELEQTNGFAHLSYNNVEQPHWWLKDSKGNIVDPTYRQFEGHLILEYQEIDDSHPARNHPRRKCCNCGEYFYETPEAIKFSPCCTNRCVQEYTDYLNGKPE